ncbi:hypothetical protein TMatcc_004523 [Talaromyces marneffei ATCC 18224]|uniref:Anaphase-promoting complex subunit 11 n=2 Tax=Talaromyces marneffei TaxID=37727 RepID=B6Q473_TALMQ|nr:uncharacterized protein EYB26_000539 [Talaromyces marneffei]EEA27198.1 hypothetical protein PMAA_020880 [Talaromyces marneffei ATCC 18224]KAE8557089.1 hypothetical protein EYB25_001795 [Talaromyces marneffei]QGA12894.1 hypothetical protein EYB26_000539 [Talaromyces marneffei]
MPNFTEIRDQRPSHLSNILGVAPDFKNNCVGFATTKGRRCALPASNIRGRAQASRLLDEGTILLESGNENIDEILEELAPLLLCRQAHQNQAGQLVYEWSRKVEKFNERRRASAGFLLRSPSPPLYHDSERARRYVALAQNAGRASPQRQASRTNIDETASIERDDNSRSIRIRPAPSRFSDSEQVNIPSNVALANAEKMDQPRNHTPIMPLVSTTRWTPSEINLQTHHARLAEELYGFGLEDSGLHIYSSSSVGTSYVSHDLPRRVDRDEPRTLRPESSNRIPVPQTIFRTPRITISESTHRQPTAAPPRPAQAISEAETSTISRESTRPVQNPARREASRSEEITRRDVEGQCSICFLPLQEDESNLENRYASEDSDDFSGQDEEGSAGSHDVQDGHEDLVWCRGRCGNNFHRECMNSWIETFENSEREPTCPICRAEWVVEQ